MIEPLQGQTDLIILPEMFTTGFSMEAETLAEPMQGPSMIWMREMADALEAALTGSLIIRSEAGFHNRLIWMEPGGQFYFYDKKYLFQIAGEGLYTPGTRPLLISYKGWKIQPLICYDLRFPEWSRNTRNYHLLLYVANWPSMRIQAWRTLLQARAIENQAYVAGVNRVGRDGNGYPYSGFSSLVSYDGTVIYQCQEREAVFSTSISQTELHRFRTKLPFLADQDDFKPEDD